MSDGAGKYRRQLKSGIENLVQHNYDSFAQTNADFRARSGMKMFVIREEMGDCCQFCADLAGVYEYGSEPNTVWQRHANCRCLVTTRTERNTWQDAWSRKEYKDFKEAREAREKEILEEITEKLVDKQHAPQYIEELQSDSKIQRDKRKILDAIIKQKNAKKATALIDTILSHPAGLRGIEPEELEAFLRNNGYVVETLKKSGHGFNNKSLEEGGGFVTHFGGDGVLQYHPAGGEHGIAYWKANNGERGKWHFDTNGRVFIP